MTWNSPVIGGIIPAPRAGHTISKCDKHLIIFGGGDGRRSVFFIFLHYLILISPFSYKESLRTCIF